MININDNLESVIQNYVLGKLSGEEVEKFEEYYLSRPDIAEMVISAQNIHIGLANMDAPIINQESEDGFKLVSTFIRWLTVPVPAFAVMALAGVVVLFMLSENSQQAEISLVNFSTDIVRSQNTATIIDLMAVKGTPAVLIKLKSVEYQFYKLQLYSVDNEKKSWQSKPFEPGALREALVVLPSDLTVSKARLAVVGIDSEANELPVDFCHFSELCK